MESDPHRGSARPGSAASHGAREVLVTSSCDILCDNQGGFVTIFGRRDYVVIGE